MLVANGDAAVTNWTVQSASSSLTISGALSSGSSLITSITQQGPGSLTTSYSGSITTTGNVSGGTPTDLAFTGGVITANNSGNWDPLPNSLPGTAPANYGFKVDQGFLGGANFAMRNLSLQFLSGTESLSGSPYSTQTFSADIGAETLTGVGSYRNYGIIGGFEPIGEVPLDFATTYFTSPGSISYGPGELMGTATLTIPVNLTVAYIASGGDTTTSADDIAVYFGFAGAIVATAPTATVPEASSLVLLGLAGSCIGFVGYRRQSRGVASRM
jgi:hypothetical protein